MATSSSSISLLTSLDGFISNAKKLKEKAENDLEESENAESFMETGKMRQFIGGLMNLYKQIYIDMKIYTREKLDQYFDDEIHDEETKNKIQQFINFENSVNNFFGDLDNKLKISDDDDVTMTSQLLNVDDEFPSNLKVEDVTSSSKYTTNKSLFLNNDDVTTTSDDDVITFKHCIVVLLRHFA